jgi:hypothetical protein
VEVAAEGEHFLLRQDDLDRAAHEDERVVEERVVGQTEDDRIGIDLHAGQLGKAPGDVEVGVGEVGPPGAAATLAAGGRIADAREAEDVGGELLVHVPAGDVAAIDVGGVDVL